MASKCLPVGAIQLGTIHSGWAFSFVHDFATDPTKATVKLWYSGSGCLVTDSTPTCVIIQPDGKTLEAFGYAAENKYVELIEEDEQANYYYFNRFTKTLNKKLGERLDWNITLEDEMGRSLPAFDVYALAVKYLVDDMIQHVIERVFTSLQVTDIYWVLTVPAMWHERGKQFVREAAIKAGCNSNNLTIAVESEAASVFCRHLSDKQTVDKTNVSLSQFKAGMKYMVLDAGGGTVDISVHEVGEAGDVKEIHSASFDCIGGSMVDKAFENMLIEVLGKRVYGSIQNTEDCLDMWRDFEVKKRNFKPNSGVSTMRLPGSLCDACKHIAGKSVCEALASSRFRETIQARGDKLKCHDFKSFFDDSVTSIIRSVKEILRQKSVRAILMVGGYSVSPVLQQAVRTSFPGLTTVIPVETSSAILRGALIIGHSPKSTSERIHRYVLATSSDKNMEQKDVSKMGKMKISREFSSSHVDGSDCIHDISCTPCSEDGKNAEAEYHCVNCCTYFCATCVPYHNRVFKTHTLLDKNALGFDQGEQSPSASGFSTLKDVCKIHAGEVIKMYCEQHDLVCCTVCVAVDHRTCKIHYIPEIAKRLLKPNEKRSTIASLRQVKTNLESLKSKREGDLSQAEKRLDGIETKIKSVKARIVQRTETLEKASIDKAQQLHRSIADGISTDIKSLENMLEGINKELNNLERRNCENEAQLFLQVKQAQKQFSNGNKCMKNIHAGGDNQIDLHIDKEVEATLDSKSDFWM